jgi:hypothetical protein
MELLERLVIAHPGKAYKGDIYKNRRMTEQDGQA